MVSSLIKNAQKNYKSLCTPSKVYLVASIISLTVMLLQNTRNTNLYCVGDFTCNVSNTGNVIIFVIKALYVIFWAWILNLICKSGNTNVSWFLVLLPFITFILLLVLLISNRGMLLM